MQILNSKGSILKWHKIPKTSILLYMKQISNRHEHRWGINHKRDILVKSRSHHCTLRRVWSFQLRKCLKTSKSSQFHLAESITVLAQSIVKVRWWFVIIMTLVVALLNLIKIQIFRQICLCQWEGLVAADNRKNEFTKRVFQDRKEVKYLLIATDNGLNSTNWKINSSVIKISKNKLLQNKRLATILACILLPMASRYQNRTNSL